MELFKIGFLSVRLLDIIDVLVLSYIVYKLYMVVRGRVAAYIITGIFLVYVVWLLFAKVLKMQIMGSILDRFIDVGVLAVIIVFQQEIRKFLILIGSKNILVKNLFQSKWLGWQEEQRKETRHAVEQVVKACSQMSKTRTGAIIVFGDETEMALYTETADKIEAEVSKRLLESIFAKTSPLHDGAVVVHDHKIIAARCVLPITERTNLPAFMGMRHRAAIGLSEQTEAVVVVVSEQTGGISLIHNGEISTNLNTEQLEQELLKLLN